MDSGSWRTSRVEAVVDEGLQLENGAIAQVAVSCWIQPIVGDLVCYLETEKTYILHILERAAGCRSATVAPRGIDELHLTTKEIALTATRMLKLGSVVDCEVSAATGTLSLSARDMAQCATGMLTQVAEHLVTQGNTISARAKHLFSALAERQLFSAKKEVRIDGELIQMG